MNNYYTLHHQSKFIDDSLKGAILISALSRKKRLLEFNFNQNGTTCQLVFHTANPSALFLQEGLNDNRTNTATFFEDIWGAQLLGIQLDAADRIVVLTFDKGYKVSLIAYGPNSNAYLYFDNDLVDQFRNTQPPQPQTEYVRGDVTSVAKGLTIKDKILLRDPRFPRSWIVRLSETLKLDTLGDAELCMLVDSLAGALLNNPEFRRLSDNSICLLGDTQVPDAEAIVYDDINTLVRSCWVQREIRDRFVSRKNQLESELVAAERRLQSIIQGLEDDTKSLQRADQYEQTGHILMSNSYLSVPDSDNVELDDVFNPSNKVIIKIKKGVSFSENAQLYYQKAKNTRKTLEANKERLIDATIKLQQLRTLTTSFLEVDGPRSFDKWLKANDKILSVVIPSRQKAGQSGKPWRALHTGKYDVWIGKSAAGNDELLQASHKEDIWFHARHVSGSHVIIRMGRSATFPSDDVIEEVASWAAWYSKAKTAGMVPVVYTKRKYVRKPKGAAPGTVLVDKEQVCLVEPVKPPNSVSE